MKVGLRDVPRAAWVMARAYSSSRVAAVVAVALTFMMVLGYALRRGAYLSQDRNGVVFFTRNRPALDAVISTALMLAAILGLSSIAGAGGPLPHLVSATLLVIPFLWLALGGAVFATSGGLAWSVTGPETPHGQRWAVAGLAQLPGTSMSGLLMARRLVTQAPPGAIVVAAAASDAHLRAYLTLGFTEGRRRRVYKIA